jgi:hypothetical protein
MIVEALSEGGVRITNHAYLYMLMMYGIFVLLMRDVVTILNCTIIDS